MMKDNGHIFQTLDVLYACDLKDFHLSKALSTAYGVFMFPFGVNRNKSRSISVVSIHSVNVQTSCFKYVA